VALEAKRQAEALEQASIAMKMAQNSGLARAATSLAPSSASDPAGLGVLQWRAVA
jgi:hypothetical protein